MNETTQNRCFELLESLGVNIDSSVEFDVNGKVHNLTFKYIIETFMQASNESQLVFFTALQKAAEAKNMGIEKFFEGMGQLLLMTHLSDKLE